MSFHLAHIAANLSINSIADSSVPIVLFPHLFNLRDNNMDDTMAIFNLNIKL